MTIQGLINKIFKANQTPNNTVSWSGVNGLKSIQEDIVDTIRQRTFFTVPTTADLVNQGFNNAVLCYVQDHAFFRWEANGVPNGTTIFPANDGGVWVQETLGDTDGTVTSIGVSMPSAFTVSNSPVTTSGVIGITGSGTTSQYIDGTGSLQTFPSLPSNLITGTGTTNYVPKFTSSTNIGNSLAYDNGSTLLIGTTTASTDYSSALLALSKSNNYTYQEIRGSGQATLVLTQGVTANSTTPAVEIFNGYNFGIKYIGGTGGAFSNYPFYYYAGNAAGSGDYIMMQTAGLERLRIVNNGNVLIGTTTDAGYKLDVIGTARITGAITTGITGTAGILNLNRSSDGANVGFVKVEASGAGIQIGSGVNMFFSNNGRIVVNSTTTDASAIFKIDSTTQGVLLPRMTTTQRNAIATPATGLSIYNTTTNTEDYYNGTAWVSLQTSITNPVTGTGSAGQVAFWNGTTTQTGSSTFTWDDTNSRLIIGGAGQLGSGNSNLRLQFSTNFITSNRFQSSSTQGFQIAHYGTVSSFWRYNDGTGNTEFGSPINYGIEFYTNNTIKAFLGSTGNFIIGNGTTDAGYKLDVNGTGRVQTSFTIGGAADGTLFFPNTTSGHQMRIYTQYASNAMVLYANGYNLNLNGAGSMTSSFCTTITGSNGSAALTVQQGNVAWTPVLVVNAIGSTGTRFNTNGNVLIGTTTDSGAKLTVAGSITAATALARGVYFNNTLVAAANNDVLVGLDITPTFTNGAFTGVTNWGLRVASPIQVTYDSTSVSGLNLNTTVGTVGIFNNISFTTSGTLRGAFGINNQSGEFRWNSTSGGYYPTIYSNGLERMRIPTTGNVLIGTTTDAGYKLDVNGTAVVRGIFYAGTTNTGLNFSGADCNIFNSGGSAGNISFSLGGNKYLNIDQITGSSSGFTSGTFNTFLTARTYSWSSGTAISNVFSITPTVNNTSTYTGTFRGIYYNPTLTSLTGTTHRAIETTSGDVILGTTSGSVGIGTNTSINSSAILDVTSTTKGVLLPRMTDTEILAIASPANGLMVYSTTQNVIAFYDGTGWHKVTHTNL